jgi:hypothetical protein
MSYKERVLNQRGTKRFEINLESVVRGLCLEQLFDNSTIRDFAGGRSVSQAAS